MTGEGHLHDAGPALAKCEEYQRPHRVPVKVKISIYKALALYPAHRKLPQKCYFLPYSFLQIMFFGEQLKEYKGF